MNSDTAKFIQQIRDEGLFGAVGSGDLEGTRCVNSWDEAINSVDNEESRSFRLARKNDLSTRLFKVNRQRFNDWNSIIRPVRAGVRPLVELNARPIPEITPGAVSAVVWDLMGACMELEYADLIDPGFFSQMAEFYVAGRFPCGWEGLYPAGVLIVY